MRIPIDTLLRIAVMAILTLLAACGRSGGGMTNNPETGEPDPEPAPPTFVRSFGKASSDALAGLAADADGELWVAGNFRGAPDTVTGFSDQPWLASLDGIGDIAWQLSPSDFRGRTSVTWKHREATPDDGALFVGEAETLEGRNIVMQRLDADGNLVWERQLDGTYLWEDSGLTFLPSKPASDEYLVDVHGRADYGWWIITHSEAEGIDVLSQDVYGAPSVFIWFVTANGVVEPEDSAALGTVNRLVRTREEAISDAIATRVAASVSYSGRGSALPDDARLAVALHSISPSGNVDQITWRKILRDDTETVTPDPFGVFSPFDVDDDYEYGSPMIAFSPSAGDELGNFHEFLHLRQPRASSPDAPFQVIKYSVIGERDWTREFPNDRFTEINDLAWSFRTVVNAASNETEVIVRLWLVGSAELNGEKVPSVWQLDEDGQVTRQCFPERFIGGGASTTVLTAEGFGGGLRILMDGSDSRNNEPMFIETALSRECGYLGAENRIYPLTTVLEQDSALRMSSRPIFADRSSDGGATTSPVMDFVVAGQIYRYERESGAVVARAGSTLTNATDTIPTGIGAARTPGQPGLVVLTGRGGVIQGFADDGTLAFDLNFSNFGNQTLTNPVVDSAGRVWMAGETFGTPLLRLENDRQLNVVALLSCFWRPSEEGRLGRVCPIEMLDIDDGSVDAGWVHAVARGKAIGADGTVETRYFKLSFADDFPDIFQIRYLPASLNDLVFSNEEFRDGALDMTLDTLDADADGPSLIHVIQKQPTPTPTDLRLDRDGASVRLMHYGETDATRWSLNTRGLALRDAVLAHDGGVVMLLSAAGEGHSLRTRDASIGAAERNIALVKLTETGEPQWLRVYGTASDELPTQVIRTNTGYAIGGTSTGVDAVTPGTRDLLVIQTGIDGRIASDAGGTDFCQAVLLSENGEYAAARLREALSDIAPRPLAEPEADSRGLLLASQTTVQRAASSASLDSDNSARQCFGDATNIQETPFAGIQAPVASFTVSPAGSTTLGTPLTLDASASTDDSGIVDWRWDIGDDGSIDATGEIVVVTPGETGDTPIRLRVTDSDGLSDETVQIVTVTAVSTVQYTLVVTLDGPGSVDIAPLGVSLPDDSCDGADCFVSGIAEGTELTLDAAGIAPAVFSGWSAADCDAVNASLCTITMTGERSVTASFQ